MFVKTTGDKELKLYRRNIYNIDEVIPNLTALVDEDKYDFLSQYRWGLVGGTPNYVSAFICNKITLLHWMVAGHPVKGLVSDHIDRDVYNNKLSNIRFITNRQNNSNKTIHSTTKLPGVGWNKNTRKWRAILKIDKIGVCLGYFTSEYEAFSEYRRKLHSIGEQLLPEHEELYLSLQEKNNVL